MTSIENITIAETSHIQSEHTIEDKEELVAAFSQLSDEAKAQFYEDCRNGIPADQSRKNMLQFVRELWQQ